MVSDEQAPTSPSAKDSRASNSRTSATSGSSSTRRSSVTSIAGRHKPRKKRISLKFQAKDFIKSRGVDGGALTDYYELGDKIGEGGFGEVFIVYHKATGSERAVKVIFKAENGDDDFATANATIKNEFATVNSLDHPNLIKQYEMFEDEDKFMIVSDIYLGGELLDELSSVGPFQEEDAALLMNHMLGCINYCHRNNVVHRDLKPENILLEESMKLDDIKIIDFGLATRTAPGVKFKEYVGSSYYMSPQIVKQVPYTDKSDVWSCGVIAFLVLAGYAPFDGENTDEIMDRIEEGNVIFDDEPDIWDSVSDSAKDFIRYLLSYEEKDRPTAQQALDHPWLAQQRKKLRLAFRRSSSFKAKNVLENMGAFEADSKLKQATYALIASQLTLKEEKEKIDSVFRILDMDSSGRLSKDEVKVAYRDFFGQDLSDEQVDIIFKRVNFSGSGFIEYSEFVVSSLLQKDLISDDKLRAAFQEFDIDGNGYIDMDELREVLVVDDDIDDSVLFKIIRQVDKDGDNQISFDEFKGMMYITASQPTKSQREQWSIKRSNAGTIAPAFGDSLSLASSSSSFQGSSVGEMSLRDFPNAKEVFNIFDVSSNNSISIESLIDFERDDLDGSSKGEQTSFGEKSLSSVTGNVYSSSRRNPHYSSSLRSLPERVESRRGSYVKVHYSIGKQAASEPHLRRTGALPPVSEMTKAQVASIGDEKDVATKD